MEFPSLIPSRRSFAPSEFNVKPHKLMSGGLQRMLYQTSAYRAKLRLIYAHITPAQTALFLSHYDQMGGTHDSFKLPSAWAQQVWGGWNNKTSDRETLAIKGRWRYAAPPRFQQPKIGVSSIEVTLLQVPGGEEPAQETVAYDDPKAWCDAPSNPWDPGTGPGDGPGGNPGGNGPGSFPGGPGTGTPTPTPIPSPTPGPTPEPTPIGPIGPTPEPEPGPGPPLFPEPDPGPFPDLPTESTDGWRVYIESCVVSWRDRQCIDTDGDGLSEPHPDKTWGPERSSYMNPDGVVEFGCRTAIPVTFTVRPDVINDELEDTGPLCKKGNIGGEWDMFWADGYRQPLRWTRGIASMNDNQVEITKVTYRGQTIEGYNGQWLYGLDWPPFVTRYENCTTGETYDRVGGPPLPGLRSRGIFRSRRTGRRFMEPVAAKALSTSAQVDTFPEYNPSRRQLKYGEWNTKEFAGDPSRQAVTLPLPSTAVKRDIMLQLVYANRADQVGRDFMAHYLQAYGSWQDFPLPAERTKRGPFAGWKVPDGWRYLSEGKWFYAGPPSVQSVHPGTSTTTLTLVCTEPNVIGASEIIPPQLPQDCPKCPDEPLPPPIDPPPPYGPGWNPLAPTPAPTPIPSPTPGPTPSPTPIGPIGPTPTPEPGPGTPLPDTKCYDFMGNEAPCGTVQIITAPEPEPGGGGCDPIIYPHYLWGVTVWYHQEATNPGYSCESGEKVAVGNDGYYQKGVFVYADVIAPAIRIVANYGRKYDICGPDRPEIDSPTLLKLEVWDCATGQWNPQPAGQANGSNRVLFDKSYRDPPESGNVLLTDDGRNSVAIRSYYRDGPSVSYVPFEWEITRMDLTTWRCVIDPCAGTGFPPPVGPPPMSGTF